MTGSDEDEGGGPDAEADGPRSPWARKSTEGSGEGESGGQCPQA